MSDVKVGSIVKLKSGGLMMTVDAVFKDVAGIEKANCVWFDTSEAVKTGTFAFHVLKVIPKD